MSLDNFRNRTIIWDTVNKDFPQPIQIMQGDVNARTSLIKIVDNGTEIDLTGHSLKLTYQYTNSSNSGFVMIPPKDLAKGEFILVIPTEMTATGVIEANLILLNKDKEQVIVSKNLTFISDSSTVSDLAQEINNNIDDFTKLLLEKMPQVLRSELNDLHAQTESNKSNIELKANLADMTSLQSAMTDLKKEVEAFGISPENLVTIKSLLDAIASNVSESEVVELINSVKVLTSNISLMSNGDYSPKANQTDLESLQHTVNDHSATISTKANQTDLDNLQATVDKQGVAISTKAEQSELLSTIQNVATAQETATKAESEAKNAMAKATEVQANSLPLNGKAVSASKLETPRKLGVNLQSSSFQYFDGTADATNIGVSGVLPIANGGTSTSDGVINTIAYSNSADGTDDFTTVYPNLNLIEGSKDFSGFWGIEDWVTDGTYKGLTVKKRTGQWNGIYKLFTAPKDGVYTFSAYVKSSGSSANIAKYILASGNEPSTKIIGNNFDWVRDSETLKLKEKDSFNVEAVDTGNLMHEVIDSFFEGLDELNISVKNIEEEQIKQITENIVEEKLALKKYDIFNSIPKYRILAQRLKKVITKSMKYIVDSLKYSDFEVLGHELEFKQGGQYEPIIYELKDGKKVEITGKIDRLDIAKTADGNYIRIIDYKSSIKNINLNEVYAGLQLQLLTYLDAACENEEVTPAGALYFNLIDPVLNANPNMTDEEITEELRKQFKMQGLILADSNIVRKMDTNLVSGSSNIVPAYIGKDGEVSDKQNTLNRKQFENLQNYMEKIIKQISEEILNGNIGIEPYYRTRDKKTPCEYCSYKAICQFNQTTKNNYNYIPNVNKEKVLEKISNVR